MSKQQNRKVIVALAPVGKRIKAPSINPLAPDEVAREVIECTDAGASLVHLHVRDRQGEQTENLSEYSLTLDLIRHSSDIIIQGSTGGLTHLTLEQRCVALNDPRTEIASLNMGSVNFGEDVYINRLPDIRFWAQKMTQTKVIPELEVFEAGMLPVVRQLIDENILKLPFSYGFVLGAHWAVPANPKSLFFLTSLMTEQAPWGVIHGNMKDLSLLAVAIGMGASIVRVGFEDSVFYANGKVANNNVELVKKLVALIKQMGFEIATPQEARSILGVKPL